jgi:ligand-binding sensor domain-containing protein
MRARAIVVVAALALAPAPAPRADGAGAWTTMLRPLSYTDLLTDGDTLWAASLEGGLLRYSLGTGEFGFTVRGPGSVASNSTTALALDRTGRLYIGTQGSGMNVLSSDRRAFSLLNSFDGMPSDTVRVLEADGDTVWIGTPRGIALWNGTEIAGRLPDGITASPFLNNDVRGIARLGGDLWVATGDGVYRSSIASGLATWTSEGAGLPVRDIIRPTNPVDALACDGTTLMALDSMRTFRWDASNSRWVRHEFVLDGTRVGEVTGLWDREGVLTAASNVGVLRWNGTRWMNVNNLIPSVFPRKFWVAVIALPNGRLVAATARRFCLEQSVGSWSCVYPSGPPGNNIQDLVLDGPRLWATSDEDGIGRYDGTSWRHWFAERNFNNSDTTFRAAAYPYGLLVDKQGRKFVGCWNSGFEMWTDDQLPAGPAHFVHLWSPATSDCRDVVAAPHTLTTSSALDSSGGHWFGLDIGVCEDSFHPLALDYYDASGVFAANYRDQLPFGLVRAVTVSGSGRIWVGSAGSGVYWFDPPATPGGGITHHLVSSTIGAFIGGLVANGSDVWALTSSDLLRLREDGSANGIYPILGTSSGRAHHPVDVAPDGAIWVGTTHGVRKYLIDGTHQDFDKSNSPLASDEVHTIRVDPTTGVVWIATAAGLNRFDPAYVPPPPPQLEGLAVSVYPNPVRLTGLGIRLRLTGDASGYRGRVLDLNGRRVRDFTARENGAVIWDGRDGDGALVRPGLYFVRVESGGRSAVARVAVVR